jgi:hypothetical protein
LGFSRQAGREAAAGRRLENGRGLRRGRGRGEKEAGVAEAEMREAGRHDGLKLKAVTPGKF